MVGPPPGARTPWENGTQTVEVGTTSQKGTAIEMLFPNKLYKKGVAAQGVIVWRSPNNKQYFEFADYRVRTRLQLPDGSTAERKDSLNGNEDGEFYEGDMIPVRYDAKDHSHFVIDFPLIEGRQKERQAQSQAAAQARVETQLARANQPGGSADGQVGASIPGLGTFDSADDLKSKLLELATQGRASVIDLSGSAGQSQSASDPVERLTKLADLKERGMLTDAEFEAEKAKILAEG